MRRIPANTLVVVAVLAVCSLWTLSKSLAEPMAGTGSAAPTVAGAPAGAQMQELNDAFGRFKAGDFDGALKLLGEAAKKNADLPPAQVMMARLFSQANIPAAARIALERAVEEEPNDPDAYVFLGDFALRERRIAEAELAFRKAESLMPEFKRSEKRKSSLQAGICGGLAHVSEARSKWADARKHFEAWLKVEPASAVAMQELARCLVYQKDVAGALEQLNKAAKADPQMLAPEAFLAQLCQQAGDPDNAKKYMDLAVAARPKDLPTRLVAGRWAFETGKLDEAKTQAAEAMKLDEKSLDAKLLRGVVAAYQKDYRTAERYLEDAYQQARDNFDASNRLALVLAEQKDDAKKRRALTLAETNARQFKNSPDAAATYGWVQYKLGKLEEADNALRVAISRGFHPDTAYYLARVDVDRNREDEAKMLLQKALSNPGLFAMRPEATALFEQLGATRPEAKAPPEQPKK